MHVTLDWGDTAPSKYPKAFGLFKSGEYEKCAQILEEDLVQESDKYGYCALGQVFVAAGNPVRALESLLEAVKIDKFYHEALCLLGDVYLAHGQMMAAIESYGQAVAVVPDNEVYKQRLINAVSSMRFIKTNPNLKGVLIECMESNKIEMMFMGAAWRSMIERDASVGPFYKLAKREKYSAFEKAMGGFANCDGLSDPFFLTGLGKFIVPGRKFENWIKNLRRFLLKSVVNGDVLFSDKSDIELITCALCRYCFLTDYIMTYEPEEDRMLDALERRIADQAPNPVLADLACYGCYKPLYALPNAKEIAAGLKGGNHVSQIPKSQIEDYWEQQEIVNEIETIGKIEDETSKAVQAQYEIFPYPRWNVAPRDLLNTQVEGYLKNKKAEILIAGCGTGKEAALKAFAFPDAHITAVDLSKTSLAYAVHKTRQLGIDNVSFYQADIMGLADLQDWQDRFDYIASAGVLHHMKDPLAGWRVLSGLLKKDGLMDIGLYSRYARWAVNEARSAIKDKNMGDDAQAIMKFRENINSYLKYKTVKNLEGFSDFYNMSECRDLLFHVQEHQFDLSGLKETLDALGMEFVGFSLDPDTLAGYQKQNSKTDPEGKDLEIWDGFEKKNPDTFVAMYRFWCRKKA